jgi:hypothetical protein
VWDLVDSFFLAFNISFIPTEENAMANSLSLSASHFRVPFPPKLKYDVEVKYRSFVLDNVKHWKVFEDDLELKKLLESVDELLALHIDQYHDSENNYQADVLLRKIAHHHIVQLPSNHIPKRLVPLERLFEENDVDVKVKGSADDADIDEYNIGTEKDPKFSSCQAACQRNKGWNMQNC